MNKGIVAVVGRPNVGKSTLFNAICKRRHAITDDMPGVTRDRLYGEATWLTHSFTLVDTGGIEFDGRDDMLAQVRAQAELAIDEADVVLFVVDGRSGVTHTDEIIARRLQRTEKPVILAVNKVDSPKQEADVYDFYKLGLGEPIAIAAANGVNLGDLLDAVASNLPGGAPDLDRDDEDEPLKVACVGRPNVGKSTLVNALLGNERSIVSNVPGTTRDAIDTPFTVDGNDYVLIDTAGMRRKSALRQSGNAAEFYSVVRALRAIDRADVVLLVLDCTQPVSDQDIKIAGLLHDAGKGVVLVVNKWDAFPGKSEQSTVKYTGMLREKLAFMQYAPPVYVSALSGQRVSRVMEVVNFVAEQQAMRITTAMLNDVLRDAVSGNPPPTLKGRQLKVLYLTQVGVKPPRFVVFVNDPELMHFSYLRYLENQLRATFGFEGTPIRIQVRGKRNDGRGD